MRRTEVVVHPGGHITASGDLTSQGADLLRGAVDQLLGNGHSRVVVDLRGLRTADDDALAALRRLHRDFRVAGGELLIRG